METPDDLALPSFTDLATVAAPSLTLPAFRPPPVAARLETRPMASEVETAPAPPSPQRPAAPANAPPWWLGAGLAVVVGVGLRFVQLPDYVLPIAVGVAVATAVVLAMRLAGTTPEPEKRSALTVKPMSRRVKRIESADGRKVPAVRLATLNRKPSSGSYRRPKRI